MGLSICLLTASSCSRSGQGELDSGWKEKKVAVKPLTKTVHEDMEEGSDLHVDALPSGRKIAKVVSQGKIEDWTVVGKQDSKVGNLEINIKKDGEKLLVCKDPVYDVTYYVNHGEDYYIYRLKDQVAELAVEMPANYLYCMNGDLYFMIESYDYDKLEGMQKGDIYRYSPVTGEVTLLASVGAHTMRVEEDGIYCETLTKSDRATSEGSTAYSITTYFYSFSTNTLDEIDPLLTFFSWNDYYVDYVLEEGRGIQGYQLTHQDDKNDVIPLTPSFRGNFCIVEDSFYYVQDGIKILDIPSKQVNHYSDKGSCFDFTTFGNYLYLNSGTLYDLDTGIKRNVRMPNNKARLSYMFTDGKNLFALYHEDDFRLSTRPGKLVQIEIEEMEEDEDLEAVLMPDGSTSSLRPLRLVTYEIGGGIYR